MKLTKIKNIYPAILLTFVMALTASCNAIYEDLDPCEQKVRVRFVYDYNMEFADAFRSQVDCLTVMVYDEDGNHISTEYAGHDKTGNEDWRMYLDLPAGQYHLIAYGGIGCEDASFHFETDPNKKTRS
ncbi:MAG: FimB/Mfa2 family fimbrial subunit, partial [Muribaculaceae bacterium]|nr:FimB/Mfa2 family fimbrial subunit [Muribaculaceae bacterium]